MSLESRDYMRNTARSTACLLPSTPSARPAPFSFRCYGYLSYAVIFLPFAVSFSAAPATIPYRGGYPLAILAFACHMAAGWLFFGRGENRSVVRALQTAVFTGIVGMGFLFGVQHLVRTDGLGVIGRFLAYAYGLTDQSPFAGNTPLLTFIGYVLSVGLLEEVIKALPVVFLVATDRVSTWRLACLVGFASGIGFGIAEGIWYHESVYNQPPTLAAALSGQWQPHTSGLLTYLIRFFPVAGLHGIYSAIAAMLIYRRRERFGFRVDNALQVLWPVSGVICIHALYNSLLAFDHTVAAFLTDVFAFLWFVAVVETSRGTQFPSTVRIGFYATAAACTLVFAAFATAPRRDAPLAAADAQGVPNPMFAPPGVDLVNRDKPARLTPEQKRHFEATVHDLPPRLATVRKSYDTYCTQRRAILDLQGVIADVRMNGAKLRVIIEEAIKNEPPEHIDIKTYNPFTNLQQQASPTKRVETLSPEQANEFIDELKTLWRDISAVEPTDIVFFFPEVGSIQAHIFADSILETDIEAVETVVRELPRTEAYLRDELRKHDRLITLIDQLGYGSDLTNPDLGPAIAEKPSQSTHRLPPALELFQENQTAEREDERHRSEKIARARQDAEQAQQAEHDRLLATQEETLFKFRGILGEENVDAASSLGNQLCDATIQANNWEVLREIAPSILEADSTTRDMTLALRAAQEASKCCWRVRLSGHSDHYRCVAPLAQVYFALGRIDDAIVTQEKAIRECRDTTAREQLEQDLARFRTPAVEKVAALQEGLLELQRLLAQGDAAAVSAFGNQLLNKSIEAGNLSVMRDIASSNIKADSKARDLGLAIRAANDAFNHARGPERAPCLALLAEAEFLAGAIGDAIYHQQDVVHLETDPAKRQEYENTLARYRAAEK